MCGERLCDTIEVLYEWGDSFMEKPFKPYIPADKVTTEMTPASIILGIVLAVVFGAANAYLGLKVGLTVSASIPAAVISMTIIRIIMRKDSILESNMVQTIGSAGESLAAGAIFTMPALFIWAKEGVMDKPALISITIIALVGGLLGVFFMVPLRSALIVKEHGVLPYPEGTACAEVLLAGEEGGSSAKSVFIGMALGAIVKFFADGLCAVKSVVTFKISALKTEFSTEIYPALISVGYICGPKISAYMFAGGLLGWFVLIPAIVTFGTDIVMYPASVSVAELYAEGGASAIWASYIKYIGAGAVAAAGIISLIKTFPTIVKAFTGSMKGISKRAKGKSSVDRTSQDLDMRFVLVSIAVLIILIWILPAIPVTIFGALLVVFFGFFFSAVSSRMVGLVGSSNNPVSGMTIATVLIATFCLKLIGDVGVHGMHGAIAIGSIICIAACMAGDTSQDLKTGYILGATPKKQQIGEIMGTIAAALAIGGVMILLDSAFGFGTDKLAAPQATMMKMIIEGVMDGNLPWALIFIGVFIAIVIEFLGVSALPVAIGLYLPLELSAPIMFGGLIKWIVDKRNGKQKDESGKGILFCSGLIAGEGILGVLLAILTVTNVAEKIDVSSHIPTGNVTSMIVLIALGAMVLLMAGKKPAKAEAKAGAKEETPASSEASEDVSEKTSSEDKKKDKK